MTPSRNRKHRQSSGSSDKPEGPIVFVSYAHADSDHPVLQRLLRDLKAHPGLSLWLDTQEIALGDSIIERIKEGVLYSDFFLFVISRNTNRRMWPRQELQLALSHQMTSMRSFVLPVRIDDTQVPQDLATVVYLDLWRDYDQAFQLILDRLLKSREESLASFAVDQSFPQGTIVQISDDVYRRMIDHFSRHPEELKQIDRRKFEGLVAELFDGFGFDVELSKQTRDGGRDIIAIKHRDVALKFLIECKRPDPGGYVSVSAVRELYGVLTHERATKGILATTAYFSPDALLLFDDHKWELEPKEYEGLLDWIRKYQRIKLGAKSP